jgi:predicted transcriptional regulator YheO
MEKQLTKTTTNSKNDFLIENLKRLVQVIAKTFGSRCEVVLHDLKDIERSIVKIENGHVTGRKVGGSLTDQGLKHLIDGPNNDMLINYQSITNNGRPLKSSSIIFRNQKGKPIAAICINFDISDIQNFNLAMEDIFGISNEKAENGSVETFQTDINSTMKNMVNDVIRKHGKTIPIINKKDRIELIKSLEDRGFFLTKGAVKFLASLLAISKYTVYNYLEEVRAEKDNRNLYLK